MYNETKSKFRQIKEGRYIRLNDEIKINELTLRKGLNGKIVHSWFYDDWEYRAAIILKTERYINGGFEGVVLNVKAQSFALIFDDTYDDGIMIDEEKLENIPFLELDKIRSHESRWYRNGEKGREYNICDVIENIEENFTDYVSELENYPNPDADEYDELQWLITTDALKDFEAKQNEIQDKFVEATGIFYKFMGGAIEE
mgnify:FL=1